MRSAIRAAGLSLAMLAAANLLACDDSLGPGSVSGIRVEPRNLFLLVGTQHAFQAIAVRRNGAETPVDSTLVQFTSSDTAIIRMSPGGLATAIQPGVAFVRVMFETDGRTLRDSVQIRVAQLER